MNKGVVLPVLDVGIKYTVLIFCSYYVFIRCVFDNPEVKKYIRALISASVMGFSLIWLRSILMPLHIIVMLLYIVVTNYIMFGQNANITIVLSGLSYGLSHAVFLVVGFVNSVILVFLYWDDTKGKDNSIYDFLNDIPIHIISYSLALVVLFGTVFFVMRLKRIRRGLLTVVQFGAGGTGIMMLSMLQLFMMGFALPDDTFIEQVVRTCVFACAMVMCVLVTWWIKREISRVYSQMVLDRSSALTESVLAEKDRLIESLRSDNRRLAAIVGGDRSLISETVNAVRDSLDCGNADEITRCAARLDELYGSRSAKLSEYESHGIRFSTTGVTSVDNVLFYMASMAEDKGVDFTVDVEADVDQLFEEMEDSREFITILADLSENAIISAGAVKDKHVEVILTSNDNHFCLNVLDSGDRFDIDVLKNMGRKRITTHKGEGGSGIGLMSLFKTLKHTGASFTIEEFSGSEGTEWYSKSVRVIFDRSSKLRIITDRADELKNALKACRFEIEKRNP